MSLQSILVTNGIGCVILVILLINSYVVRLRRKVTDRIFTAMIFLTASACILEGLSFILDGKVFSMAYLWDLLINSYLYFCNITVSYLWCLYVDLRLYRSREHMRKNALIYGIPSFIGYIGILLNFKFNYIFTIDDSLIYHRNLTGYLYFFFAVYNLAQSVVIRQIYYKKYGQTKFFPIYMFIAPICLGAVVQVLFYGVSVVWCSVAMGLVGTFMCLQNELSYIDPLTKLYNRNYLDHILRDMSRKHSKYGGLMIDMDFFKIINDTFGHTEGDKALVNAANIISSSMPDDAIVCRFAGDEFIVLLRSGKQNDIDAAISSLRKSLTLFNEQRETMYELSLSVGSSIYDGAAETTDTFLHEMDENMYAEKKNKHAVRNC